MKQFIGNGEIYELVERNYCVYEHVNKINGKKYIGMTKNPKCRWRNNGYAYRGCPHFWKAIQKYGWDNFEHTILRKELTHMEACELEIKLIAEQETIEKGYNLAEGGCEGETKTPEQLLAQSEMMTNRNSIPELNPMTNGTVIFGKTHPYPSAVGVRVTERDGSIKEFVSVNHCARHYNIPFTSMNRVLSRKQPYIPHKLSASKPNHKAIEGYTFERTSKTKWGVEYELKVPPSTLSGRRGSDVIRN